MSLGNGVEWLGTIVCAYTHAATAQQLQSVKDLLLDPACRLCTPVWERAVYGNMRSAAPPLDAPADGQIGGSQAEAHQAANSNAAGDEEQTSDSDKEDDNDGNGEDASTGWGTSSESYSPRSPEQEASSTQNPSSREAESSAQAGAAAVPAAGPIANNAGNSLNDAQLRQFTYFLLQSFLGTRPRGLPNTPVGTLTVAGTNHESTSAAQQLQAVTAEQLLVLGKQLWEHRLIDCSHDSLSGHCSYPGCTEARDVLLHLLTCTGHGCWLCQATRLHFTPGCPDLLLALQNPRLLLPEGEEQVTLQEWLQVVRAAIQQLPVV